MGVSGRRQIVEMVVMARRVVEWVGSKRQGVAFIKLPGEVVRVMA